VTGPSRLTLHLLSLVFAALILAFVLVRADPPAVWRALRGIETDTALTAVLLNLPVLACFVARSMLVLRRMGHMVPLRVLVPASIVGNVAGALTPAASGELLRAGALQRSGALSIDDALVLVAYERLLSTFLLVLSTGASLALVALPLGAGILVSTLCVAFALAPWLLATIFPRLPSPAAIRGEKLFARIGRYGLAMVGQIWALFRDVRLLISWSALTLLTFAIIALQFSLVARSLGEHVSLLDAWVAFGGSGVAAIASFVPFGLGVADGSLAALLSRTGIAFERATAIALMVRAVITLPLVVAVVFSYVVLLRTRVESASS
jgi:uncharacterized protein (TIRG00374 family)